MAEPLRNPLGTRILAGIGRGAAYVVMSAFALMTVAPIIWLIINSFKSTTEFRINRMAFPHVWTTINFPGAWKFGEFDKLIGNSVIYTLGATVGIIFFSILAGFAFAKIRSRATPILYGSFVLGILLSIQSLMVPLFIEVSQLDRLLTDAFHALGLLKGGQVNLFYDTRIGVLLIYIGSGLPTAIYLSTEYIKGIPYALVEAARIDGAGYFKIFRWLILPMSVPIATTVAILNITGLWNEFALINILVSKSSLKSLPLGIFRFSSALMADYGKQFAALVIGMMPMLVFYIAFRKQITRGVTAGAVKG
ncbi:MAG TPA: carbohydrate ABC transporter permease [Spirochaetia bacterium]|nr:carbohydrate ABC transporter permease [Spirochaetia bacterium]